MQGEFPGGQLLPRRSFCCRGRSAIFAIPEQRQTASGELDANLMTAAGDQFYFQQREPPVLLPDQIAESTFARVGCAGSDAVDRIGGLIFDQPVCQFPRLLFGSTLDEAEISLLHGVSAKLLTEATGCFTGAGE